MYDLIIKNGTVVTDSEMFKADVAVQNGKIACVAEKIDEEAQEVCNAEGKLVLPGAIDAHTHLAMAFGGTTSSDDYFTGTRAAVCGGVTTVFDYAQQRKGDSLLETVKRRNEMAKKDAVCDYAFHCIITDLNGDKALDEFEALRDAGVSSVKIFMVYKKEGMIMDDGGIVKVLKKSKETGILVNVHAENPDVIDNNIEQFLKEGKTSAWYHYLSRPEYAAAEADKRIIHWAKSFNTPVYIVHLTDCEGVEELTKAKDEGYEIYAETCPQYLHFTCDVYKREDGRNFICSPPMKGQKSQDALWAAIKRGDIDTIATDHCPFQSYEKDWGKDDFTKVPNGCAGVENVYPYMLDKAGKGIIPYTVAVKLCSTNPAKIFGCTTKGAIAPGKDADIVVYDPEKDFTITQSSMHSKEDHTIWEGTKLHGYPVQTYSRGKLVYDNGQFLGEKGWGKYIKRAPHKRVY